MTSENERLLTDPDVLAEIDDALAQMQALSADRRAWNKNGAKLAIYTELRDRLAPLLDSLGGEKLFAGADGRKYVALTSGSRATHVDPDALEAAVYAWLAETTGLSGADLDAALATRLAGVIEREVNNKALDEATDFPADDPRHIPDAVLAQVASVFPRARSVRFVPVE